MFIYKNKYYLIIESIKDIDLRNIKQTNKFTIIYRNNKKIDGGFAVIPGSHKSNFIRPQNSDPKNNYKLLKYIDASPGDAIIFTESLAHGSLVNYSNNIRRIFIKLFF